LARPTIFEGTRSLDFITALAQNSPLEKLISSLLLLLAAVIAYHFAAAAIRRTEWSSPEARRRWLVMVRNTVIIL
jgi:hypothetical protein